MSKFDLLVHYRFPGLRSCENPLSVKSNMADDSEIFEFSNRYNSAMDYSIVIKFGTEFDH